MGVRLDPVPRAHHPDQLGLGHAGEAAVTGGVGSVGGGRQARAAGQHVQRHPRAEPGRRAGRLTGEHPRRAGLARAPPPGGGGLHGEQLIGGGFADLSQLLRRERGEVPAVLLAVALVQFAQPVQRRRALRGRHRIRARPGGIIVPPRVRGNRFRRHVPPPVRHDDFYRT